MCRSRRELSNESLLVNLLFEQIASSNEYLLAKIGVDTAENEPLEVWGKHGETIQYYSLVSLAGTREPTRSCRGGSRRCSREPAGDAPYRGIQKLLRVENFEDVPSQRVRLTAANKRVRI